MRLPALLLGAGLLFWGWQSGNLAAGGALALLLEAPRFGSLRLELRERDYRRIADFSTVLFVAAAVLLVATRGVPRGVLATLQWLPALLAPIVAAQRFGVSGRIRLSALLNYLRRRKAREPEIEDPLIDLDGAYLALTVIAAGAANARGAGYYAGIVALAGWALYALRPARAPRTAWAALFALGAVLGYAGQAGLAQLQGLVEDWAAGWILHTPEDPYRSRTDIGSIGRLQLHDTIVLRVFEPPARRARVQLLHTASFNTYSGTSWIARGAPLAALAPQADGRTWVLDPAPAQGSVEIAERSNAGRALLALPAGTVRLTRLDAATLRRNALGAASADGAGRWIRYRAEYSAAAQGYAAPTAYDLELPTAERAALEQVAGRLGLAGLAPAQALGRVRDFLAGFSYSTWNPRAAPAASSALTDFLLRTHSGHCEYFAAAATLLLRAAGVPARYATGFAVMEYSALEQAWIVRARHAHAWSRAFVGGRWVDVDTTPPVWVALEAERAPAWQGIEDLLRWAAFRLTQRGGGPASPLWWWAAGALTALLGWRLLRLRRAARRGAALAPVAAGSRQGMDSEFFALERALVRRVPRRPDEPLSQWAARVAPLLEPSAREDLRGALALHQRYRFDPRGLGAGERARLRERCAALSGAQRPVLD